MGKCASVDFGYEEGKNRGIRRLTDISKGLDIHRFLMDSSDEGDI